jgi:hypothetical protein
LSSSKKRSARLDEPFVFFVDRCLGRGDVPGALGSVIEARERVEIHDDHFPQDAQDADWLPRVGFHRWIVLSHDRSITRRPLELDALLRAGVAFFGVGAGHGTGPEVGAIIARAVPQIRTVVRRFRVPIIATVSDSAVTVKWAAGVKLERLLRYSVKKSP